MDTISIDTEIEILSIPVNIFLLTRCKILSIFFFAIDLH